MKSLISTLLVATLSLSGSARADDDPIESLKQQVSALQAEIARLSEQGQSQAVQELERRIDLLAGELEKQRTAGAISELPASGQKGLAPAASKVYGVQRGVSIGGYGEVVYQGFAEQRQDGLSSGRTAQLDFLRQIVYLGYKFDEKLLFNSEIEFEHGSTGKGGEVSVEFGYLEYQFSRALGARAGMLLMPMGFLNELHEPPIFQGSRRPDLEQVLLPTTWRENGAGVFGEAGPVQWRAYVTAGLSSTGFTASGIRDGRQSGARSKAEDFALSARLDYTGMDGLLLGGSFYTGGSGQGATVAGQDLQARVHLFEAHAQYEKKGLQLRALAIRSWIGDAALVNQQNGLVGSRSVGESQAGWYAQAAFDLMSLAPRGHWSITPFLRYEKLDAQREVPTGFSKDPAQDRSLTTFGVGLKPITQVVLKADWTLQKNQARSGVNQFNVAVGWLF